ncbi:MAG: hypothetical protein WEA09_02905 [Gemmatimonadota bacterium]
MALLQKALQTLSSPLEHPSSESWRRAVIPALRDLLRSQDVLFLLPRENRPDAVSGAVEPRWI